MWFSSLLRKQTVSPNRRPANRFRPALEALEDRCLLSGGVLDPTFGTGGVATAMVGAPPWVNAVATYAQAGTVNDGKIVVAGGHYAGKNAVADIVRLNLNGTKDPSFAGTGVVTNKVQSMLDVAVQADGKVLAVGTAVVGKATSFAAYDFGVVRYNANGSLDTSFGGTIAKGQITTDINSKSYDQGERILVQADGKIIVAGITGQIGVPGVILQAGDLALVRYNTNGSLDTSFGNGGKVIAHFPRPLYRGSRFLDLAIDPGSGPLDPEAGKIVVTATLYDYKPGQGGYLAARFNTNGSLDASFGGGAGHVTFGGTTPSSLDVSLAVQSDHRIAVVWQNGGLTRLNADGTQDITFAGGVVVKAPVGERFSSVAIQPDGQIMVSSKSVDGSLAVVRYNAVDGSLDASFGINGVARTTGIIAHSQVILIALEPDGRIVAAGSTIDRIAVTRFLASGPQIGSFTANPNPATAGDSLTLSGWNITDLNPNSTINQVAFYLDSNDDGILQPGTDTLLGFGIQASPGVWSFTFSTASLASQTYRLFAQAKDNYGVFGDPLAIFETLS